MQILLCLADGKKIFQVKAQAQNRPQKDGRSGRRNSRKVRHIHKRQQTLSGTVCIHNTKYYDVNCIGGVWKCSCPYRRHHKTCKHIRAVQIMLDRDAKDKKGRGKKRKNTMEITEPCVQCPSCSSKEYRKTTSYKSKRGEVPVLVCKECNHRFVFRLGFKHKMFGDDFISICLFLCSIGLKLGRISETMMQISSTSVDPATISRRYAVRSPLSHA